jgi:hypothetical protein
MPPDRMEIMEETEHCSTQLMLCNVWGSHGGDYEEFRLLGCYTVWA